MTAGHWPRVHEIYAAGIAGGDATFETAPPSWAEFDAGHLREHRLVAIAGGTVAGWVAVAPVSARPVYAGVVEHSVYVDPEHTGRGVGRALLAAAIESTQAAASGRCGPASSRRTSRAWRCTSNSASGGSACTSGSAATEGCGATSCCSSGAAGSPAADRPVLVTSCPGVVRICADEAGTSRRGVGRSRAESGGIVG
jgi:L-amino acid N-acyltransferase YncA